MGSGSFGASGRRFGPGPLRAQEAVGGVQDRGQKHPDVEAADRGRLRVGKGWRRPLLCGCLGRAGGRAGLGGGPGVRLGPSRQGRRSRRVGRAVAAPVGCAKAPCRSPVGLRPRPRSGAGRRLCGRSLRGQGLRGRGRSVRDTYGRLLPGIEGGRREAAACRRAFGPEGDHEQHDQAEGGGPPPVNGRAVSRKCRHGREQEGLVRSG